MTPPLTSRERFQRMYDHREADRIPVADYAWPATVERWQREGLPKDKDWCEYFGIDRTGSISVDNSPRYPVSTIEETEEYHTRTSVWGTTLKTWKHAASTPEFLDYTVVNRDSWEAAKLRMTPTPDRVTWKYLESEYPKWQHDDRWIEAGFWFGFDVTHSWMVGTERLLEALLDDPEWCVDMFNHFLDLDIALFEMIWEKGYRFHCINWPDDLGYKGHQFMSTTMYRELLKPVHKRAADWAHARGIKVRLHSCGDVRPLIPEFLDWGVDCLNPLEVKAGVDPAVVKKQYGDRLVLHGGVNAVLWDKTEAIEEEMRRVIPTLKQNGGYIFASDHSIPSAVSLEDFRRIIGLVKELGRY